MLRVGTSNTPEAGHALQYGVVERPNVTTDSAVRKPLALVVGGWEHIVHCDE